MDRIQRLPQLLTLALLLLALMAFASETRTVAPGPNQPPGQGQVTDLSSSDQKISVLPVAQGAGRTMRLALLPDYEQGTVEVDGVVSPGDPKLTDWGLAGSLHTERIDPQSWHVYGPLSNSTLSVSGENGHYQLSLGPLSLAPGDSLALIIPFVNILWQDIDPPPDNLAQLTGPVRPLLPFLRYEGGETGRTLQLNIPFRPIRKEIDLTLTPLVGEFLMGQADSFRLSGQVTFDGIEEFATFGRYCESSSLSPFFRYRVADLLFSLDYPPAFHFGLLSPVYQYKPHYTLLRSDLLSCEHQVDGGQVQAQFQGRIFYVDPQAGQYPDTLSRQDVVEAHEPYTGFGATAGEYELKLGEIVLAPDDRLRVTVPQTTIRSIEPPPNRFVYSGSGQTQIEYEGPQRLALSIRYTPNPQLLLRQTPATGRAFLAPLEGQLGPFLGNAQSARQLWSWGLLVVGLALGVSALRGAERLQMIGGFFAWLLLSAALLYGLRGIFGWLVLAVGWYFGGNRLNRSRIVTGIIAIILVLAALWIDAWAETLFGVLSTIELELTPLTPLILTLLSLALYRLITWRKKREKENRLNPLSEQNRLAIIVFLFSLSVYDVLQKSLLALLLVACGAAYIIYRISQQSIDDDRPCEPDLSERLRLVQQSWLVPGGVLLFTILAMRHNLQQTAAVFGPTLGLWGPILIPVLLFISVLLALSAIALLFIWLYPALPFRAGYLKAIVLGLFLLAVFVLGVGSDDRLVNVLETLIAGRFVYYLSMPLLLGLYFDIHQFQRQENTQRQTDGEKEETLSFTEATGLYLKQLRGLLGAVSGIVSLVAPSVYAFFFNQPIVTTYFDLLEQLISLSVAGF